MRSEGFNPKDLEDICSRKRTKFKMKKSDYKELRRNTLLGSVDLFIGALGAAVLTVGAAGMLKNHAQNTKNNRSLEDGFRDGHSGYGNYFGDIRSDDK